MPTSGLLNTDAYRFKSVHFSVPSASRTKRFWSFALPMLYAFPRNNLPAGHASSKPGVGDKVSDPKHLESDKAEEGAETGPACICMS